MEPSISPESSLFPFFRMATQTTTVLRLAPTNKSGSNWLDRLRSNKGIPTGDNLDLDSFLLADTNSQNSLDARPHNPTRTRTRTHSHETHDPPMSTVLAELFSMGATLTQTQTFKKCPRKQTHPKFFLASSSSTTTMPTFPTTTAAPPTVPATSSQVEAEEEEEAVDRGDDDENDKDGNELKGFSRSEVTVIDTSCPGWKVDKFVFRKHNVWKVRERKPKSRFFTKKKRKDTLLANGVDDINGIGTSKDNVINMRGEKPVKTQKLI